MKKLLLITFLLPALAGNVFPQNTSREGWSSMKTLSVPYEVRIAEFEKGNLVRNPSFEIGEIITTNENGKDLQTVKLDNWQLVGKNVQWVNSENKPYSPRDVSTGKHAVKIYREFNDVKEIDNTPDGVISDFIEVIPGNYNFTFETRLERVFASVQRDGSKLEKDVDVRLNFFDENKKLMSPGIYYEYYRKDVDNGFKGFAFSNFYYIDKFDWGVVSGRTYNFPFSEGDIPDGCKYIKISLGLLGRGTMYVDNIDFQYSRWNFTTLERLSPFFEKDLKKTDLIIPTPKKASEITRINLKTNKPVIVIPDSPENPDLSAAQLLKKFFGTETPIVNVSAYKPNQSRIAFVIGKNKIFTENAANIDLSEIENEVEGYVIKKVGNKVFLVGQSAKGSYMAAATLVQLFDKATKIYYHADIVDFPDFKGRSYLFTAYPHKRLIENNKSLTPQQRQSMYDEGWKNMQLDFDLIHYYSFFKLNKVYNNYAHLSTKWWEPGEYYNKLFEGAGKICNQIGTINTGIMINPYFHLPMEYQEDRLSDSLRNIFSHSNPDDIRKITDLIDMAVKQGAKTVMICADDHVPHAETTRSIYTLFTARDKAAYTNLADAQSEMLSNLQKKYGKTIRIEFVPAAYLNEFIDYGMGSAEAFFRDFSPKCPQEIAVIWTGNTVRSLSYDMADIRRYSNLIGRKPMLWDNTPYAREALARYGGYPALYPGKAVMCCLFEPYDIIVPKDFYKYMDTDIYSNGGGFSELYKIKYPTFADFAWNNNAYNPDLSLYKTLVWLYGKDNAMKLLRFNDTYFRLESVSSQIRDSKQIPKEEPVKEISPELKAAGELYLQQLEKDFKELSESIQNDRLLKELEPMKAGLISRYTNILKSGNLGALKGGYRQY